MAQDSQDGQMDLLTRIELMRTKTGSAERVSQINSMTKRTGSMLDRQTDLDKALISARSSRQSAKS
jgi:hypothetical protein